MFFLVKCLSRMTQVKGAAGVSTVKSDSEPPHIRPFPAISEECVSPRVKEVKGPCQVSRKGEKAHPREYSNTDPARSAWFL